MGSPATGAGEFEIENDFAAAVALRAFETVRAEIRDPDVAVIREREAVRQGLTGESIGSAVDGLERSAMRLIER